jgi:hypothetical protein
MSLRAASSRACMHSIEAKGLAGHEACWPQRLSLASSSASLKRTLTT